jgi:heterodisulfide reductase subunit C
MEEISAHLGQLDLSYCFQCGMCSGSCPTVGQMQYGPRKIMQMVRLGVAEPVLRSRDMWMCVSCYLCSARCPQGIQVADVMGVLRNLSLSKGFAKDAEATFSKEFVNVLTHHGRLYEPELLVRYYMATANLPGLMKQGGLGLAMFRKGKIALRPERIQGIAELKELVAKGDSNGGTA